MMDQKSRALGSDSSCLASKIVAVFVDDTSTTGDAPLTVTVSWSDATFSSTLTVAVNPTPMLMPSRITMPKPPSSYWTEYTPGATPGRRYTPSSLVTVVRAPWSAGLVAVTVTPGSTPPLASATRPFNDPVVAPTDCALAPAAVSASIASTHTPTRMFICASSVGVWSKVYTMRAASVAASGSWKCRVFMRKNDELGPRSAPSRHQ